MCRAGTGPDFLALDQMLRLLAADGRHLRPACRLRYGLSRSSAGRVTREMNQSIDFFLTGKQNLSSEIRRK